MKKLITLLLVIVLSWPALAQMATNSNSFFEQLTNKYADKEGFSASMITKDMFDLYLKKKNVDSESSVFNAINNLDKILIVSQSNMNAETIGTWSPAKDIETDKVEKTSNELYESIVTHYKGGEHTLLKTEKRMGEEVKVYLRKNQEKVESLALITNSSASTNLIELQGDINLTAVAELNKALNLRGLENLYKINNSENAYFGRTVYSQERLEEMVARQRELAEKQRFLSDEQRAKIEEQAQIQVQKQMEMAEKYREMAEKYRRQPIFLNYPGDTNTVYYINNKKVSADKIKELENEEIKSIEVKKAEKENDKTTIKIKTK